jgi:hypothetical protein
LEPSEFRPIAEHQQKGTDGALIAGLRRRVEWVFHDPHVAARVDFKSGTNLNSYEVIGRAIGVRREFTPWETLNLHYPKPLVTMARRALREAVAA